MKPTSPTPRSSRFPWLLIFAVLMLGTVVGGTYWASQKAGQWRALPKGMDATYVGRDACIQCHSNQAQAFQGSHHDKAMDLATEQTVLADFKNVELEHLGVRAKMTTRDGKYFVNTEGPDGQYQDYQVKWVFGVTPLQQYMVEIERKPETTSNETGRVQVLRWSWDTEKKQWFHLDPPDVPTRLDPHDPLHWTGSAQRWNSMCADCHSTNLQKNFRVQDNSFHTTFSEIDVSCEACHGPGSIHVQLSQRWIGKVDPHYGYGLAPLKASAENQIQACAPCHARRELIALQHRPGDNYYDHFAESLLLTNIYFADGQVQDEDYIHGSFLQSKMYHKGIKCTNCHDPHTAKLKHDGNQVCTSCHQHPTAKYDSVAHHFHKPGQPGSQCVNCHMPSTTYMAVDPRRDHSLRIPRPDVSVKLGTPNACTGCHLDKQKIAEEKRSSLTQYLDWLVAAQQGDEEIREELKRVDQWCDDACNRWYGEKRYREEHFATAIDAARRGTPDAADIVSKWFVRKGTESPAIARATMLVELSRTQLDRAVRLARRVDRDDHSIVRRSAAMVLGQIADPGERALALVPFLDDPSRSVRVEAARGLSTTGDAGPTAVSRSKLDHALAEYRESLLASAEQSGAHLGLGILDEQLGNFTAARGHYENAIRLEPQVAGPRTNLAVLLEGMAERNLQSPQPQAQQVGQSLLEKAKTLRREELPLLERDASLMPKSTELQYRLGLAYYLDGNLEKALAQIQKAIELSPDRNEMRMALILLLQKMERIEDARREATELKRRQPENAEVEALWRDLQKP